MSQWVTTTKDNFSPTFLSTTSQLHIFISGPKLKQKLLSGLVAEEKAIEEAHVISNHFSLSNVSQWPSLVPVGQKKWPSCREGPLIFCNNGISDIEDVFERLIKSLRQQVKSFSWSCKWILKRRAWWDKMKGRCQGRRQDESEMEFWRPWVRLDVRGYTGNDMKNIPGCSDLKFALTHIQQTHLTLNEFMLCTHLRCNVDICICFEISILTTSFSGSSIIPPFYLNWRSEFTEVKWLV